MLFHILNRIDAFLILFLKLKSNIKPCKVKLIKNNLIITTAQSNQRFMQEKIFKDFLPDIKKVDPEDRTKLGLAIGKTIATNLVISFDA